MTITQIQYALALHRYKNYHKSAEVLEISQPALSMQIQKFEQELGFQIFDRSQKQITVTTRGTIFLERAMMLQTDFIQLKKLGDTLTDQPQGTLHIGIIPTIAPYILPFFIEKLTSLYPNLYIHIKEALTDEIIEGLKSGTLDGGIISTPLATATPFEYIPLFYEGFKLYTSPLHPLALKEKVMISDLDMNDLWLLTEGNCFRNQVINMCDTNHTQGTDKHLFFESSSIESLCRILEYKNAITIIPELSTLHIATDKEHLIKDIEDQNHVREVSMLYLPNTVHVGDLKLFSDLIVKNIPKRLLSKGNARLLPITINPKPSVK
jgi:LysR family transcriptional regulator, hydrogen peroxide-inducible genes activator